MLGLGVGVGCCVVGLYVGWFGVVWWCWVGWLGGWSRLGGECHGVRSFRFGEEEKWKH